MKHLAILLTRPHLTRPGLTRPGLTLLGLTRPGLGLLGLTLLGLGLLGVAARADPARILAAEATEAGTGWRVSVTLEHGDTGWEDYADGWRVERADGTVIGTRILAHPHVNEQPFTRSLSGVTLPEATDQMFIRARTSTTGWGDARHPLPLN